MSTHLQAFHLLIAELLKQYGIHASIEDLKKGNEDVYTLSLENGQDIHLIGTQENYLNTACFLPIEHDQLSEDKLHALLSANLFSLDHPVISVGVSQKRQVVLSSRQILSELDAAECYQHIESVIAKALALKEWLGRPENTAEGNINALGPKTTTQSLGR